jgi:hypothetical protein
MKELILLGLLICSCYEGNNTVKPSKASRIRSSGKRCLHQNIDPYPSNLAFPHPISASLEYCGKVYGAIIRPMPGVRLHCGITRLGQRPFCATTQRHLKWVCYHSGTTRGSICNPFLSLRTYRCVGCPLHFFAELIITPHSANAGNSTEGDSTYSISNSLPKAPKVQ